MHIILLLHPKPIEVFGETSTDFSVVWITLLSIRKCHLPDLEAA